MLQNSSSFMERVSGGHSSWRRSCHAGNGCYLGFQGSIYCAFPRLGQDFWIAAFSHRYERMCQVFGAVGMTVRAAGTRAFPSGTASLPPPAESMLSLQRFQQPGLLKKTKLKTSQTS